MAELFAAIAEMVMSFFFGATQPRQPTMRRRHTAAMDPAPGATPDQQARGEPAPAITDGGRAADRDQRENPCT